MRVCLVYDCLYPYTVGGAERWYLALAEHLTAAGHDVTYLTLRQWARGQAPEIPGVRVRVAGPRMRLYVAGRRRTLPPIVFGAGVLWHLLVHGRRYDVVHMASFPYFSVLAAAPARRLHRFSLLVDWHEVWSRSYWREYLGRVRGPIGWWIQKLCVHVRQRAFCFSRLHAERLRGLGLRGDLTRLEGEYAGPVASGPPRDPDPLVVFAGRYIPEKQIPALVRALPPARESVPGLRAELVGDGPERPAVMRLVAELGLEDAVDLPGFVPVDHVEDLLSRALCLVLPSRREGYGLIVVEAAALGTPTIVVRAADNAAVELIEDGVNGFVADSAEPADLAGAIVRVHQSGAALRASTREWFARHASRLSLEDSMSQVLAQYQSPDNPAQARSGAQSGSG